MLQCLHVSLGGIRDIPILRCVDKSETAYLGWGTQSLLAD